LRIFLVIFLINFAFSQEKKIGNTFFSPEIKSLIIPGWGNYEKKDKTYAFIHFATEIALVSGYFFRYDLQKSMENDYKSFAKKHLNLPSKNFDTFFYEIIARYSSYEKYVEYQLRQDVYSVNTNIYKWKWENQELRADYTNMRKSAIDVDKNLKFFFFGMIVNRAVSYFTTKYANSDIKISHRSNLLEKRSELVFSYSF
jgi:hypothetical protein